MFSKILSTFKNDDELKLSSNYIENCNMIKNETLFLEIESHCKKVHISQRDNIINIFRTLDVLFSQGGLSDGVYNLAVYDLQMVVTFKNKAITDIKLI